MSSATTQPIVPFVPPGLRSWELERSALYSLYATAPFSQVDPLYSLPDALLDSIEENLPGWLTAEELSFERGFAALCAGFTTLGSFCGRPIPMSLWQAPTRVLISRQEFRESGLHDFMTYSEWVSSLTACYDRIDLVRGRLEAYRGWLVTNPEYLSDVAELKARWGQVTSRIGSIPQYLVRLNRGRRRVPRNARDVSSEFEESFNDFYEKWDLSGLLTWEFPEPFGPNLAGIPFPPSVARPATTLTLQAPVSFALPSTYSLNELLREIQNQAAPPHLQGWIDVCNQRNGQDLGFGRFRQIFQLYFLRETVLRSRYEERFAGHVERLDLAFGEYLGVGQDSVKRLRLYISQLRRGGSDTTCN